MKPVRSNHDRRAVATAILTTAIVGAGWYFVAMPRHRQAARLERDPAVASGQVDAFVASDGQTLLAEAALRTLPDRLAAIRALTDTSGNAARLYAELRRLAARERITIDRSDPTRPRSAFHGSIGKDEQSVRPEVTGTSLDLSGTYEGIARFVHSCETELGATRITSFRLRADPDPRTKGADVVTATVDLEHLRLDWPGDAPDADARSGKP